MGRHRGVKKLALAAALAAAAAAALQRLMAHRLPHPRQLGKQEEVLLKYSLRHPCPWELLGSDNVAFEVAPDTLRLGKARAGHKSCDLTEYADRHHQVLALLRGKHLVMIGDSVTRYQYLSLVYFLEHKTFFSPAPEQTWEKGYRGWNDFYGVTNGRLNGNEACDCHRNDTTFMRTGSGAYENRYYYRKDLDIRVTFFVWFGSKGMAFHEPFFHAALTNTSAAQQLCAPGQCHSNVTGTLNEVHPVEFARDYLPKLKPHYVVLNCGLWLDCGTRQDLGALANATIAALAGEGAPARNALWKTTTVLDMGPQPPKAEWRARDVFSEAGTSVMQAEHVTAAFQQLVAYDIAMGGGIPPPVHHHRHHPAGNATGNATAAPTAMPAQEGTGGGGNGSAVEVLVGAGGSAGAAAAVVESSQAQARGVGIAASATAAAAGSAAGGGDGAAVAAALPGTTVMSPPPSGGGDGAAASAALPGTTVLPPPPLVTPAPPLPSPPSQEASVLPGPRALLSSPLTGVRQDAVSEAPVKQARSHHHHVTLPPDTGVKFAAVFRDHKHFSPPVYAALNTVMLNMFQQLE